MKIFESESDLLAKLAEQEQAILRCATGDLPFWDFCENNGSFYNYYALDGHESDEEELHLLEKHRDRIEVHRIITEDILNIVCSDADAKKQSYIDAGRFGSAEALRKMRKLVEEKLENKN